MITQIRSAFLKWLTLPNTDVIDILCGAVVANRLDGPPVFLVIVGPSGSGKSVFIESLNGLAGIIPISKITPHTLLSGMKGREKQSLLMRLDPKKPHILTMKDLTTTLSQRSEDRNEILGQLREVYDGSFVAEWGTTERSEWNGKMGLIVGSTGVYDALSKELSALGHRFLVYRPARVDAISLAEQAMRATSAEKTLKAELNRAMTLLDTLKLHKVPIGYEIRTYVAQLCAFLAHLRTPVTRDPYTRDITQMPEVESTGRLAKQFTQLLRGITIARGAKVPGEVEVGLIDQIAMSSVPSMRLTIIRNLPLEGIKTSELQLVTRIPNSTFYRLIEDMELLGLMERQSTFSHPKKKFRIFYVLAQKTNGY